MSFHLCETLKYILFIWNTQTGLSTVNNSYYTSSILANMFIHGRIHCLKNILKIIEAKIIEEIETYFLDLRQNRKIQCLTRKPV